MPEKVRVVIADDQNIARGFFELSVRSAEGYELVKSLPSAELAAAYCDKNPVDLVIMDVMMRYGMDGLTAAKRVKEAHPEIKIIIATSSSEASWEEEARRIGVESFWYKEYSLTPLQEVMDRTMSGDSVYPDTPPAVPFGKITRSDLTDRELEILRELTNGCTNEEIAEKLIISTNTVKFHIRNLMEKTGFESRMDLAIQASALELVISDATRTGERFKVPEWKV